MCWMCLTVLDVCVLDVCWMSVLDVSDGVGCVCVGCLLDVCVGCV